MILVRCYLPLRYSCNVLTSSTESSFIEQIERVAAIAAFIVVKYGSLKRSTLWRIFAASVEFDLLSLVLMTSEISPFLSLSSIFGRPSLIL